MSARRPDPDALLARVNRESAESGRGRLKIFFGATAGVGKTYAMLETAQQALEEGRDVVVGWVETHGREETAALLEGLEVLPSQSIEHRGVPLREFDLDAALARHPALLLLDELAHSNAPGSRHAKRWQDAMELLEAGVDVHTTLNVQHLESLNDVVAQITGVTVRETIPDSVLERADEVELIDLPPDDLLQRLREGKVYVSEQARRAIDHFFQKGNLIALRELALRRTAERVDTQMLDYRRVHGIATTWPVSERLLVCVGPNPGAARLVRSARRMAAGLHAEWTVAYVETPGHARLPESDRRAVAATLRLAEQLGATTEILSGEDAASEILLYAREHNVSKIVAGKPTHSRWRDRIRGSLVGELVRGSGGIDIYVISGDSEEPDRPAEPARGVRSRPSAYGTALLAVAACTVVSYLTSPFFAPSNLVMIYLLGVAFVSVRAHRGPAVLASVLSVAAFDFFFVPPRYTFAVNDTQYVVTFVVMLGVALVISDLATRVRMQADIVRQRERRTAVLYSLSRELAATPATEDIASAAARHVSDAFSAPATVLLPRFDGRLVPLSGRNATFTLTPRDEAVARWVLEHGRMAGMGTDTLPGAGALFLPVAGTRGPVAVLGVRPPGTDAPSPDSVHLLEALASQTAAALERARLAEEAQSARVTAETEKLRSTLLSSVSHDLRTPLASITGSASTLLDPDANLPASAHRDLIVTIHEEADRLNRLVANLLDMTRLESGAVQVKKEWLTVEEIVGAALTRLETRLARRPVTTDLPHDLPLVALDGVLIEQVLVNLIENALKYTRDATPIEISARAGPAAVTIEIADRGPGIPEGAFESIFDKFHRLQPGARPGGVGLGLTICKAIVTAHGGKIWVDNRSGGGAVFAFTLPRDAAPPSMAGDKAMAEA